MPPYNILLLMTDQHRADHVGFLPGARMATPNLDRLAESVAFRNCITSNPICTPARSSLLTGKYSHQIGMLSMSGDLSLQHPTYARALQRAGYWTAGVGKFHWMQGWPWDSPDGTGHDLVRLRPQVAQYGFDYVWEVAGKQLARHNYCEYAARLDRKGLLGAYREHLRACGPNGMSPEKTRWNGDPWPFDEEDYVDHVIGDEILRALRERPKDRPFFLFGSFCGPHKPYDPPASALARFPLEEVDDFTGDGQAMPGELKRRLYRVRRAYKAMIAVIDDEAGRILRTLEAEGLLDNTVILFTADHGEMLGDRARMSKQQPWRHSVAVPTAIRHPAHLRRAVVEVPVELTDVAATLLDVAGLDPVEALSKPWPAFHDVVPCRSLLPIVRGETNAVCDMAFSECHNVWQLLQSERWKYIRFRDTAMSPGPPERLFDLWEEPDELHNLAEDPSCAGILAEFRERRVALNDATPPAQLQWAPYGSEDGRNG